MWTQLGLRSKPAPEYGRKWRKNKAWRKKPTLRNEREKGENGERKEVERNHLLSSVDLKAELRAVGCHGDSEARTAPFHWLKCESQ